MNMNCAQHYQISFSTKFKKKATTTIKPVVIFIHKISQRLIQNKVVSIITKNATVEPIKPKFPCGPKCNVLLQQRFVSRLVSVYGSLMSRFACMQPFRCAFHPIPLPLCTFSPPIPKKKTATPSCLKRKGCKLATDTQNDAGRSSFSIDEVIVRLRISTNDIVRDPRASFLRCSTVKGIGSLQSLYIEIGNIGLAIR